MTHTLHCHKICIVDLIYCDTLPLEELHTIIFHQPLSHIHSWLSTQWLCQQQYITNLSTVRLDKLR